MNKVRHFREMKSLRQIDLAKKANISMTWLWALENGFEDRVSFEIKIRVANALNCDYDDLFRRKKKWK